jgi:type IX secretion system PorP/SprF family membrane protein
MRTLLVGLLMFPVISFAQNTLFWNHYSVINPASTGLVANHNAFATYSNVRPNVLFGGWTLNAGYDAKLKSLHGGLGINLYSEKFAWYGNNVANVNYSYHQKLGENNTLAIGVAAGMLNMNNDDFDTTIVARSETHFNLNLGTVFKGKRLEIGVSCTQLNQPAFGDSIKYNVDPTLFLYGQYNFRLSENLNLIPRLQYINYLGFDELQVNATLLVKKQYWVGMGYFHRNTFSVMAGVDLFEKFRLGYSLELPTHNISPTRMAHSFALAIMLGRD